MNQKPIFPNTTPIGGKMAECCEWSGLFLSRAERRVRDYGAGDRIPKQKIEVPAPRKRLALSLRRISVAEEFGNLLKGKQALVRLECGKIKFGTQGCKSLPHL